MYQSKKELFMKGAVRAGKAAIVIAGTVGSAAVFADDTAVQAGIQATQTQVLSYIGMGITAALALLAASLAPDIGISLTKKWVKKGAK